MGKIINPLYLGLLHKYQYLLQEMVENFIIKFSNKYKIVQIIINILYYVLL